MTGASQFFIFVLSRIAHAAAIPRLIQTKGKALSPDVLRTNEATVTRPTNRIPNRLGRKTIERVEGDSLALSAIKRNASAAQRARIKWKKGSQRKLQRKTL